MCDEEGHGRVRSLCGYEYLLDHSYPVTVLLDSRASHSFVVLGIVDNLKLVPSLGSPIMSVTMPAGDTMRCEKLCRGCPILIIGQEFIAHLYHFDLTDSSVI